MTKDPSQRVLWKAWPWCEEPQHPQGGMAVTTISVKRICVSARRTAAARPPVASASAVTAALRPGLGLWGPDSNPDPILARAWHQLGMLQANNHIHHFELLRQRERDQRLLCQCLDRGAPWGLRGPPCTLMKVTPQNSMFSAVEYAEGDD